MRRSLPPLRGLLVSRFYPQLTLWAEFLRRPSTGSGQAFAAETRNFVPLRNTNLVLTQALKPVRFLDAFSRRFEAPLFPRCGMRLI